MSSEIIYRYKFRFPGRAYISMPKDAEIIHFGFKPSEDIFSMWAKMKYPTGKDVNRGFYIAETGRAINSVGNESFKYISSCIIPNEEVWHLFEIEEV